MSASPLDALDASTLLRLLLAERERTATLAEDLRRLQAGVARQNARIVELEEQYRDLVRTSAALGELRQGLTEQNQRLREEVAKLHRENAAARGVSLVPALRPPREEKAATPVRAPKVRKKRAATHNTGRHRMERPNRFVTHASDACAQCGTHLPAGWVARRVQVIELPVVAPLEITEHRMMRQQCPKCGKRVLAAPVGLEAGRIGQCRFGPRLITTIAIMRAVERLPIALMQARLEREYGLRISMGGISGLLQRMADAGEPAYAQVQADVRGSPVVYSDETGWRENGQHTTIWTVSTTQHIYVSHGRRTNEAIDGILGADFGGTIVADCYGAYQHFACPKQRCWAHLVRDIQALIREHGGGEVPDALVPDGIDAAAGVAPEDAGEVTLAWAEGILDLYRTARGERPDEEEGETHQAVRARAVRARQYEAQILLLCPADIDASLPYATLAKRLHKHLRELFTFVRDPAVEATNNAAERSLRPLVIARKISGGTRSSAGSRTRMILYTLCATARMQGKDPTAVCEELLLAPPGSPSPLATDPDQR